MIPEATLNQILERVDIVELVNGYVPLRRMGRSFKACCPFHNEKTPSFIVNTERQTFHCFGCGVGGNAFGFVMRIERRDFPDVVEMLAEKVGVEVPKDKPRDDAAAKRAVEFVKANQAAMEFYHRILLERKEAEPARDYLRRRGLKEKTISDFRVGFAPESWDALHRALKEVSAEPLLEKAGLLVAKREGGYYDRFRNRVIFPILDGKGVCVAFGGRVMDDSVPKYLNSPETEIYIKGRQLYGLFQARKAIRDLDQAIVVEGYMDLIACHQAGVENVVASLGTALTPDQARLIKRNSRNVVILYDSDKAGEAATLRGLEIFLEEEMDVRIVRLPEGYDPDSYVRDLGVEMFRTELEQAKSLFEFKLETLQRQHPSTNVETKAKIANEMVQLFAKVPNEILKSAWTKELAKRLMLNEASLFAEMKKREEPHKATAAAETPLKNVPMLEITLLGHLLESPEFAAEAKTELTSDDFRHPGTRAIVKDVLAGTEALSAAKRMNHYKDDPEAVRLISHALAETDKLENPAEKKKSFEDCLRRVRRSRLDAEREGLSAALLAAEREGDKNRISRLLYDLEELNKRDRKINEKK